MREAAQTLVATAQIRSAPPAQLGSRVDSARRIEEVWQNRIPPRAEYRGQVHEQIAHCAELPCMQGHTRVAAQVGVQCPVLHRTHRVFRDDHMHTDELGRLCMARPHCMALAHGMDARTDAHIQDAAVHTPDCTADTRLRHDMRLDICVDHMQAMRGKARRTSHCVDCMGQHS